MRLLVVEDEKHLNQTLTERLTKIGYTVDNCFDGEDALYYIENTQYDEIILDVMMPKINGFEVLRIMREKKILTPVLVLTAKDSDEDIISGLDLGANDYLTKPFSFDVLCARIRAMLRVKENVTGTVLEIADETLLLSAVTNLISNGIKYGKESGQVRVAASKTDDKTEIVISDNGVGISKEHIDKIWTRFYRVDDVRNDEYGSSGLGLSMVKSIIELHGGEISVKSAYGQGTEFRITII